MGMAASQARFLGLTARQNNVEYEGQQVNQQRTTLANQTANYYNQLLGMTVPVPPSAADYTKTVYTFEDGNLSNSITALIAQPNGEYKVSYVSSWVDEFTPVANGNAIITKDTENGTKYYYGSVELRKLEEEPTTFTAYDKDGNEVQSKLIVVGKDDSGNPKFKVGDVEYPVPDDVTIKVDSKDPYLKTLSAAQIYDLKKEEEQYLTMIDKKYADGDGKSKWYIRYQKNTTTGTYEPIFYNQDVVSKANFSEKGTSQSSIPEYRMGSAPITEEHKNIPARLEKDATGRYINITMYPGEEGKEITYSLTTNTVTDQAAYDDAMNQYEYNKYQYDQSIQEINAKIEIIQAQDKNLELRLKQLDTEQKALQSEKEAVSKVVEKNVDSTFKTFG